jgi:hypothetical protein
MSNWLLNLPVVWMEVVIFVSAYLLAALVHRSAPGGAASA